MPVKKRTPEQQAAEDQLFFTLTRNMDFEGLNKFAKKEKEYADDLKYQEEHPEPRSTMAMKALDEANAWDPTTNIRNNMLQASKKFSDLTGKQQQTGLRGGSEFANPSDYSADFAASAAGVYNEGEGEKNKRKLSALNNFFAQYGAESELAQRDKEFYENLKMQRDALRAKMEEEDDDGELLGTLLDVGTKLGLAAISDRRFKKDISLIGVLSNGLNVYTYSYKWSDDVQIGVMADEVEKVIPNAVIERDGYKYVDYSKVF